MTKPANIVIYLSDIKSSDHNCPTEIYNFPPQYITVPPQYNCPTTIYNCPTAIYNCPTAIYNCLTAFDRNDYFVWMEQLHLSMKLLSQI